MNLWLPGKSSAAYGERVKIRAIEFSSLSPFAKGRIEFPAATNADLAEVHILTGVNGTGKSRLLAALAAALGDSWELQRRSGARQDGEFAVEVDAGGEANATVNLKLDSRGIAAIGPRTEAVLQALRESAAFAYSGGAHAVAEKPRAPGAPANADPDRLSLEERVLSERLGFQRSMGHSERFAERLGKLVLQTKIDLANGETTSPDLQLLNRILETVRWVVGAEFDFAVRKWPEDGLKVKWRKDTLELGQLPDGLRSLIAWMVDAGLMMSVLKETQEKRLVAKLNRIHAEVASKLVEAEALTEEDLRVCGQQIDHSLVVEDSLNEFQKDSRAALDRPSILLLDEIETHLHPAWQRRVLPAMQRLFPKAQIFIATHSPFVISSLNHGWIHRLRFDEAGNVKAYTPRKAALGDTYEDVLEDIMEMPERFDPDSEAMLNTFEAARDAALAGDASALPKARELAVEIAKRGPALEDIVGRELRQLERLMQPKQ